MNNTEESLLELIGSMGSHASTSTSSGVMPTTLTLDDMLDAIKKVKETIAKLDAPFREWMVKRGCDPKDGYVLWLPKHMQEELGPVPSFVLFGPVTTPMITKDFRVNLNTFRLF